MKRLKAVIIFLACAMPVAAGDSEFMQDSVLTKHHYLSIDPISACLGTLLANYEYRLNRHGFFGEGHYSFPLLGTKAYGAEIAYRFHFKPIASSSFISLFCKYGKIESSLTDESRIKYSYVLKYKTLGAGWGIRGKLFKKNWLFYTIRMGAGYPISSFTWKQAPPETIGGMSLRTMTNILKISAFLDSELTLTFGF